MRINLKITPGDRMFSLYIRYRDKWTCQRCLERYPERSGKLQNSHYWGRGNMSVRHDEDNCVALCGGCHMYLGSNPNLHRDFILKRLGEVRFDQLEARARMHRSNRIDDRTVFLAYRELLRLQGVHIGKGPALSTFTP
jgi:NAD-dependent dihydropyrimidine dehydrogenase PreA subunit